MKLLKVERSGACTFLTFKLTKAQRCLFKLLQILAQRWLVTLLKRIGAKLIKAQRCEVWDFLVLNLYKALSSMTRYMEAT